MNDSAIRGRGSRTAGDAPIRTDSPTGRRTRGDGIGTAGDAPKTIYQVDLKGPVALVLGAEGPGMRQLTRKTCDELVSIPMHGAVENLFPVP